MSVTFYVILNTKAMSSPEQEQQELLMKRMENVQSQLLEMEASLQKKENSLRSKIDAECQELEKIALRNDFYKVDDWCIVMYLFDSSTQTQTVSILSRNSKQTLDRNMPMHSPS
jgi:hypothetical protein